MNSNILIRSGFAFVAGDLVGALADRVTTILDNRVNLKWPIADAAANIFLQVGIISLGTSFAIGALPYLNIDGASSVPFVMGVITGARSLPERVNLINKIVFSDITALDTMLPKKEDK